MQIEKDLDNAVIVKARLFDELVDVYQLKDIIREKPELFGLVDKQEQVFLLEDIDAAIEAHKKATEAVLAWDGS